MELVDRLIKAHREDLAEKLKSTWKNAIVFLCTDDSEESNIPVGASKVGGYPDLPPEIEFPVMSAFKRIWLKGPSAGNCEEFPEVAMQLMAQINLSELAQSGADVENVLPKTGMLYFFNSHFGYDVFSDCDGSDPYYRLEVDKPEYANAAKVIYWDGDMSTLRRVEPPHPYFDGVMPCLSEPFAITFGSEDNYDHELLDSDDYEEICQLLDIEDDDLVPIMSDKLLGVPWTVNPREMRRDDVNLFQMRDDEGCIVSDFWAINNDDLKSGNLSAARFWVDCD